MVATTMRAGAFAPIIAAMDTTEIVVAVQPDSGPLCGAVRVETSPERPFDGWLGLLSALQAAITELEEGA